MAGHLRQIDIIHSGPFQLAVIQQEAAGLDDVHRKAEAGPQTQQASGILGDVGLI